MGILALKAVAKGPWPKDAEKSKYPKCWYEPLSTPGDIRMGLRFTLSHPVTAALTSGQQELFKIALSVSDSLTPLNTDEMKRIKEKGLIQTPLFKFPSEKV
jgi:hypothetical protein